ncbi:hypothetical protein R4641_01270 [Acinetobacter baumannii]|nr:hypothetical protein [Acinetobacter baumannii]MDV7606756.1 hypothetical protein [Acinetobacter baumannii]QHB91048.1 hypothetical protein F9K57_11930 [Acinetobacter baumannii]HCA5348613.1 hypothetical protein [Acinetobacter baumannii]HEM6663301.1 hypothetical protein [Acinetobacter baumannii]
MKMKKMRRTIVMNCPVCADTLLKHNELTDLFICNSCSAEFGREELLEANSESIDAHTNEIANKAIKEVKQHLQKEIKNIFKNSKVFKVK